MSPRLGIEEPSVSITAASLDPARPELSRRSSVNHHVIRGSAWAMTALGISAITGTAFWLLAAHTSSAANVGKASAMYSGMQFVSYLTAMGLPIAVARYGSDTSESSGAVVTWSLLYTVATSAIGAAFFLTVFHPDAQSILWRWGHLAGFALFFAFVAGVSVGALVDVRLIGARRWGWVVGRSTFIGITRLPLLVLHPFGRPTWLLIAAAGLPVVSAIIGVALLPRLSGGGYHLRPLPPRSREIVRYAHVNYLATLISTAAYFILPVIVLSSVPASVNASFYLAWSMAALVCLVPVAIGQVLLVEGGRVDGPNAPVRLALGLSVGVMALCAALSPVLARAIVILYGPSYRQAGRILPILILAAVPWAVTVICLAEVRVKARNGATLLMTAVGAVAVLGPAAVLVPRQGIAGATHAWLLGNMVGAVVSYAIASKLRRTPDDPRRTDRFPVGARPGVNAGLLHREDRVLVDVSDPLIAQRPQV